MTELLVSIAILAVIAVMAAGGRDASDSRGSSPAPTFSSTKGPAVTTTPNYQLWANAALSEPGKAVVSTDTFISKWKATLSSSS